jgi:septum formation protein
VSPSESALILASASPRRRELLSRIGIVIEVAPADIDEALRPGESPAEAALRLAADKAGAVAASRPGRFVLAADTVVEIDGRSLGKPGGRDEAAAMLAALLGREHRVTTGLCLIGGQGAARRRAVTTRVIMRGVGEGEIAEYLDSGEWRGKAGAYAIQGIAAALVTAIEGSVTNVIGLPLAETVELLAEAGGPRPSYRRGQPA